MEQTLSSSKIHSHFLWPYYENVLEESHERIKWLTSVWPSRQTFENSSCCSQLRHIIHMNCPTVVMSRKQVIEPLTWCLLLSVHFWMTWAGPGGSDGRSGLYLQLTEAQSLDQGSHLWRECIKHLMNIESVFTRSLYVKYRAKKIVDIGLQCVQRNTCMHASSEGYWNVPKKSFNL